MCWSDIMNTAIGAFLGFISAYALELIIRNKQRQNSIKNIMIELKDLKTTLYKTKDNDKVINVIYIPIWDSIVGTGDILSYIKKPYYEDLIMIYSNIIDLKELEKTAMSKNTNLKEEMKHIVEKRNALYEKLNKFDIESLDRR